MSWAPDYATADQVLSYLNVDDDTVDQIRTFVTLWTAAVSRNVDKHCGRQFGQTALEERFYEPVWDRRDQCWYATIDDVQDVTGFVIEDDDGTAVTDYVLLPRNNLAKGKPYERLKLESATGDVAVTAKYGWATVPAAVPTALYLQAARLNARRSSPFGIAGSPSQGSEIRLLAQLDPDFITALRPYVRAWWAA